MAKKKTHEEFIKETFNLIGDEYTIEGVYINSQTKIEIKHNICNHEFNMTPNNFLNGQRCPYCLGKITKTTEMIKQEIYNIVQNEYEIKSEYINATTKILMQHNYEGCNNYQWELFLYNFLGTANRMGSRCPKCAGNITKTHDEFVKEVYDLVGEEYSVLSEYKKSNNKILIRHNCIECNNYQWEITANSFLGIKNDKTTGTRCPKCCGNIKKSQEEYINEVRIKNPSVIVLGQYINTHIPILHMCSCGSDWFTTPTSVLNGSTCKVCIGMIKKTTESYKNELTNKRLDIEVLEEYIDTNTKIKHRCSCGNIWITSPTNVLSGSKCMECSGNKKRTTEQYKLEVEEKRPNIKVLEEYINNGTAIRHQCECGNDQWMAIPTNVLNGISCSSCSSSKGETIISEYLINNHFIKINKSNYNELQCKSGKYYIPQKEFDGLLGMNGGSLSYDFYLPEPYNLLIEYQGEFHDGNGGKGNHYMKQNLEKQKEHDRRKKEYAIKHGIRLLEIWYWEQDNIEQILSKELQPLLAKQNEPITC